MTNVSTDRSPNVGIKIIKEVSMRRILVVLGLVAIAASLPSISEAKFGKAMKGCIMDMYSNYADLPYWGARPSGVVEGFYNACRNKGIPQV